MLLLALIDKRALYTNDRRCRLEEQPYRSLCITILEVTIETNHSVRTQYTLLACHLELHETTELHGFVDSAVHPIPPGKKRASGRLCYGGRLTTAILLELWNYLHRRRPFFHILFFATITIEDTIERLAAASPSFLLPPPGLLRLTWQKLWDWFFIAVIL